MKIIIVLIMILGMAGCSSGELETIESIDDSVVFHLESGKKVALAGKDLKYKIHPVIGSESALIGKKIIFVNGPEAKNSDQIIYGDIFIIGLDIPSKNKNDFTYRGFDNVDLGFFRGKGKVLAVDIRSIILENK